MRLWALLPSLPLGFYTKEALVEICNKLGVFVGKKPNWESKVDQRWVYIQIEWDVCDVLLENMDLVFEYQICHHKLDYQKLPLCCFGFHEIGHV
jgi:hypothetical protein